MRPLSWLAGTVHALPATLVFDPVYYAPPPLTITLHPCGSFTVLTQRPWSTNVCIYYRSICPVPPPSSLGTIPASPDLHGDLTAPTRRSNSLAELAPRTPRDVQDIPLARVGVHMHHERDDKRNSVVLLLMLRVLCKRRLREGRYVVALRKGQCRRRTRVDATAPRTRRRGGSSSVIDNFTRVDRPAAQCAETEYATVISYVAKGATQRLHLG